MYNEGLRQLIRQRNWYRRKYQNTHENKYRVIKNILTKHIKKKLITIRNDSWHAKLNTLKTDDRSIWTIIKKLEGKNISVRSLHTEHGIVFDDVDKSEAIAEAFAEAHNIIVDMGNSRTDQKIKSYVKQIFADNVGFDIKPWSSPRSLATFAKTLKNNKSPGPDRIPNIILKYLPIKFYVQKYYIFKFCIKTSYFPDAWKIAKVLAFPKPGKDPLVRKTIGLLACSTP